MKVSYQSYESSRCNRTKFSAAKSGGNACTHKGRLNFHISRSFRFLQLPCTHNWMLSSALVQVRCGASAGSSLASYGAASVGHLRTFLLEPSQVRRGWDQRQVWGSALIRLLETLCCCHAPAPSQGSCQLFQFGVSNWLSQNCTSVLPWCSWERLLKFTEAPAWMETSSSKSQYISSFEFWIITQESNLSRAVFIVFHQGKTHYILHKVKNTARKTAFNCDNKNTYREIALEKVGSVPEEYSQ